MPVIVVLRRRKLPGPYVYASRATDGKRIQNFSEAFSHVVRTHKDSQGDHEEAGAATAEPDRRQRLITLRWWCIPKGLCGSLLLRIGRRMLAIM